MKRSLIIFLCIFISNNYFIQSQTRLTLSFSQSATEDWKQGEKQTFEFSSSFETKQTFNIDNISFSFSFRYSLGAMLEKSDQNKSNFIIPTDNELYGETVLKYPLG